MSSGSAAWLSQAHRAFLVTSKIKQYYKKYSSLDEPYEPVSTEGLLQIVHAVTGWEINILEVEEDIQWYPKHLKGKVLKKSEAKIAELIIPALKKDSAGPGATRCERRFAVVKEICHLLIDNPTTQVSRLSDLTSRIVGSAQTLLPIGEKDPIILQEYTAELAALELLLWHENRSNAFDSIDQGRESELDVARRYLIPECKISHLRSIHSVIELTRNNFLDELDEIFLMEHPMPSRLEFTPSGNW